MHFPPFDREGREKIKEILVRVTRVETTNQRILKGLEDMAASFADLQAEITANIANQNAFMAVVSSYQQAAQALITQLEAGSSFDSALASLKSQDAALTTQTQQVQASTTSLGTTAASVPPPAPSGSTTPVSVGDATGTPATGAASGTTPAGQ